MSALRGVRQRRIWLPTAALGAVALVACAVAGAPPARPASRPGADAGWQFWPRLLASSTDLGPAREHSVSMLANLRSAARPAHLEGWAHAHGLRVKWLAGQRWAALTGSPAGFGTAFGVVVHDYRARSGQRFFGSLRQPVVPEQVAGEVVSFGRLGQPPAMPRTSLVPNGGLSPTGALQAYDALDLAKQGYTGKGQTVVFFEWAAFDQADLDKFTSDSHLPPMSVERFGDFTDTSIEGAADETTMDIEDVHAMAPDAKLVIVDATSGFSNADGFPGLFAQVDQKYPGAIWSLSISWNGCEKSFALADIQALDAALATAESHGTTAYTASGDTDGLECKASNAALHLAPPSQADVGVLIPAALPSMTSVGGTTLSVSEKGEWFNEMVWGESSSSLGTGGGVASVIPRPDYQAAVGGGLPAEDAKLRITPDVSADADPVTGISEVYQGETQAGGGTSQSAPIWAALTAVMNQYLEQNGGKKIGALNPIVYALQSGHPRYVGFHDISLGGNAVWMAAPGWDAATGWGSPDTWNLVRDILDYQKGGNS